MPAAELRRILGLFIVQEAVRAHGGRVSVESTGDRGTTFTVVLPCAQHVQPLTPDGG